MSGADVEATDSVPDMTWHTGSGQSVLPEPVLPPPAKPLAGELVSPRGPLWAVVAGYVTVAVSLLVFVGWGFGIDAFKSVLPSASAMTPFTAVSLLALGLDTAVYGFIVIAFGSPDLNASMPN